MDSIHEHAQRNIAFVEMFRGCKLNYFQQSVSSVLAHIVTEFLLIEFAC